MLFTKMRQYSKALNELYILTNFLIEEKIDDKDDWLKDKIK